MRGEDEFRPLGSGNPVRNTPTCVGKTWTATTNASGAKKHPHVRGEDLCDLTIHRETVETPPRAWGRLVGAACPCLVAGNTPTCVGKTPCDGHMVNQFQKHPHVRGEDAGLASKEHTNVETPPRAWGRLPIPATSSAPDRNTPTCVGKTPGTFSKLGFPWKHPHVRGEDRLHGDDTGHGMETPPRAWGRRSASCRW